MVLLDHSACQTYTFRPLCIRTILPYGIVWCTACQLGTFRRLCKGGGYTSGVAHLPTPGTSWRPGLCNGRLSTHYQRVYRPSTGGPWGRHCNCRQAVTWVSTQLRLGTLTLGAFRGIAVGNELVTTIVCSVLCCALLRLLCLVIAVLPRRTEAIPCAAMTMVYAVTYCALAAPLLFG